MNAQPESPQQRWIHFPEPGRGHIDSAQNPHARAVPAHLDPRVTGLDQAGAPRRRSQFFGRRSHHDKTSNPTSNAILAPIDSPRRISVVGLKGGVGKTTLSILMAKSMARARKRPVLLLDSDTTYGSLMLRTGVVPVASAHDVAQMGDPGALSVLSSVISRTEEDVWVLPTGRSPQQSAEFDDTTYVGAMRAVFRHFPITITDSGTGMAGPLMDRIITASHSLVIATSPSLDGVLASHNALQWLGSLGYHDLLNRTIVAISNVSTTQPQIDIAETRARFAPLCRAVITVPADPHLAPGSLLEYDKLDAQTQRAASDLAAVALEAALGA